MREVFLAPDTVLIGHNITGFDIIQAERLLEISVKNILRDTLGLSWYLYPNRRKHGLEDWGSEFGVPKPEINDWDNLTIEEYIYRCDEDVKITKKLWLKIERDLLALYDGDAKDVERLIKYVQFKMHCAALSKRAQIRLDIDLATKSLDALLKEKEERMPELIAVMPVVEEFDEKTRPAKPFKKDGSLSVVGAKWFNLLREHNLPEDFDGSVRVKVGEKEPNPGSHLQIKNWLFSLGWVPEHYDYKRNKDTGELRKIPQIKSEDEDGQLCPSIIRLAEDVPEIGLLAGMGVINHRISVFNGFLENHVDGYVFADIAGFTNTMRFRHRKPLTNLPKVSVAWGREIRGCLLAREGYEFCGSDMSSLEDRTKLHYMFKYDPEYVQEMSVDGFDPHLDLAKIAGDVTAEQVDEYVNAGENFKDSKEYKAIGNIRHMAKTTNYSCTYGAGYASIARKGKISEKKAKALHTAYWERNWAIKEIADNAVKKRALGLRWIYNPVSKFWYHLKVEKDAFSTLNQSTGVYCFDTWIRYVLSKRPQLSGQFHDEIILEVKKGHREECENLLRWAIKKTNELLNLNRDLDVDVQFGERYSEIH